MFEHPIRMVVPAPPPARAAAHAFAGREAAERNAVLRELSQLQQQPRGAGAMLYRRERLHPTGCVGGDGAQ